MRAGQAGSEGHVTRRLGRPITGPMVVAALNQASPRVVDCNDKATEKLVHALERLTSRMDNLQTKVRDLRARSHGTECGG